ncbi:MAG: hypothetical protein EBZ61_08480 [Micrococcales bacterium]|nr:hypothetical protein [Micrococcales bacterium]
MAKKSTLEKLALPMFFSGIMAMLACTTLNLNAPAQATSPVQYKKVTLTYLASGNYASESNCGSYSNLYSSSAFNDPTFRARTVSNYDKDGQITCSVTLYVVTNVEIPTPKPVPTVTVIYKNSPSATPTYRPTVRPTPTISPTKTPEPVPSWWSWPTPLPTKAPRH